MSAVKAGHEVRAGIHGQHDPFSDNKQITSLSIDATDQVDVRRLIAGCDAVVSLIGHTKRTPQDVQTIATKIIVLAMESAGIRRFVSLTGTGVRVAGDKPSLLDRILNIAIGLIDSARIKDGKEHVAVLQHTTKIDWTVLRVLKLTSGSTQLYRLSNVGPARLFTARATVASAILRVLEESSYERRMPIIVRKNRR